MGINDLQPKIKKEIILKELKGKTIPQLTDEKVYDLVIKDTEPRLITENKCYIIKDGELDDLHSWESKRVVNGLWISNFWFSNILRIAIEIKGTHNILIKRLLPYYAENEIEVAENGIRIYTDVNDSFLLPLISEWHKKESVEIPELEKYNKIYIGRNELIINKKIRAEIDYYKQYIRIYNKEILCNDIEKTLDKYLK
jgi:hypothetical protein